MIPNTMAFSGIFPDFRTHIMYLYTYTTSGAKANGTTTPCAVASGQAARQSLCTTPSEGRQHRRVRLMLFHFVSTCFHMFPHVSTCFHMFPVLRHDFHLMSARFRQGWSVGVERERELKPRNRHIGPTATRIFQFIQEEAPWNFPHGAGSSSEQDMKEGFLSICYLLRKDNQNYCGRW